MQNYGGWRRADVSALELLFEFSFLVDKSTACHSQCKKHLYYLPHESSFSSRRQQHDSKARNDFGCTHFKLPRILAVLFFSSCIVHIKHHVFILCWEHLQNLKETVLCECFQVRRINYSSSLVPQLKEWLRLPVSASPSDSGEIS